MLSTFAVGLSDVQFIMECVTTLCWITASLLGWHAEQLNIMVQVFLAQFFRKT